jgi:hypothetical protein
MTRKYIPFDDSRPIEGWRILYTQLGRSGATATYMIEKNADDLLAFLRLLPSVTYCEKVPVYAFNTDIAR